MLYSFEYSSILFRSNLWRQVPPISPVTIMFHILSQTRARTKSFSSSKKFDMEMERLFEKARRWHQPSTASYGRVLLLQVRVSSAFSPLTIQHHLVPAPLSSSNLIHTTRGPALHFHDQFRLQPRWTWKHPRRTRRCDVSPNFYKAPEIRRRGELQRVGGQARGLAAPQQPG